MSEQRRRVAPLYIVVMGDIFRMSRTGWRKYLQEVAARGCADPGNYGAHLGRLYDTTNITLADARLILDGGMVSSLPRLKED